MREVLKAYVGLPAKVAAVALVAAAAVFAYIRMREANALEFASSVISENSPIAELATRKLVWKVVHIGSTASTDTVRETVYTIKTGYDLAKAPPPEVDGKAKTVTICLPPPKIISVDYTLQRTTVERKTFFERVFGTNADDGRADREDLARLAEDCDRFGLLSAAGLREAFSKFAAARLREMSGYELKVKDGLDIPAQVMFNAYFEEKGVDFRLQ